MDMDYLRERHRESQNRARVASSEAARLAHQGVADFYANWIAEEEARLTQRPVR
jgi:hypothetical protein